MFSFFIMSCVKIAVEWKWLGKSRDKTVPAFYNIWHGFQRGKMHVTEGFFSWGLSLLGALAFHFTDMHTMCCWNVTNFTEVCFFFWIQSPGDGKHSTWENPAQKLFVHHFTSAQTCWICFANRRRRKTHCFKNQFLIATFFSNDKQGWNFSFMIVGNECI